MDTIIYILLKTKRSLIRDTKFIGPAPPSYGERERERESTQMATDGSWCQPLLTLEYLLSNLAGISPGRDIIIVISLPHRSKYECSAIDLYQYSHTN